MLAFFCFTEIIYLIYIYTINRVLYILMVVEYIVDSFNINTVNLSNNFILYFFYIVLKINKWH